MKLKHLILSLVITTFSATIVGQNVNDVFTFSKSPLQGTARYISMGGAFQALGGDSSAVLSNPAGSVVFLNSEFNFSVFYDNKNTASIYNNSRTQMTGNESDVFSLGQASLIFPSGYFGNAYGNNKVTFGIIYTGRNYYKNDFVVNGTNSTGIDSYFLNYSDGVRLEDIEIFENETIVQRYSDLGSDEGFGAQQAFLGYRSFLINPIYPDDNTSSQYRSALSEYEELPLDQKAIYNQSGSNHRLSFNLGAEIDSRLSLGVNAHLDWYRYTQTDEFQETGYDPDSPFSRFDFGNEFDTRGQGISLQIGGIARITDQFRVGLTYDTPQWIEFEDQTSQYVYNHDIVFERIPVDPILNVYPPHFLRIAAKYSFGAAYVFNQAGLISIDYSLQPLQNSKFSETFNDGYQFFSELNTDVSNYFQTISSLRIGGELNFNQFSIRGGFYRQTSPFVDINQQIQGFTGGIGYKFGPHQIDAAIVSDSRTTQHQFYSRYVNNGGKPFSYYLENAPIGITLSYHYKFL